MTAPTNPAKVTLGGREFTLRYSIGAMKRLKEKLGTSIFKNGIDALDENTMADLLYEGLHHGKGGDPDLTMAWLEEEVAYDEMIGSLPLIFKAMKGSLADAPENPPQEPTATAPIPVQ